MAIQLDFQVAMPMNVLRTLNVVAEGVPSPSFTQLFDLVPTEAPLSEMRLLPSFVGAYFLQPPWFPILQNLTVLIVNGRDIHEPFGLLPGFTQIKIFEADRLPLPLYELNTNLPLLGTLQKLKLRASSVQWMAGRRFLCLEECAILLPHHWEAVQQHGVQLPFCRKLTYDGYPMTTVQCFHVPKISAMELRSHDCREQRVYQQLHHLCTVNGRVSELTTLHLTLQCSEKAFIKVLKYLGHLQKLVLCTAHSSPSWRSFLKSLTAEPSSKDWPEWSSWNPDYQKWEQWCSSQNWHTNVLPNLRYLGIQRPKGFSQSECLDNIPLLRLVGWTRAQLTPPLENLKVWEGRGTADNIMVDYTSTDYLDKHLGISNEKHDSTLVRGMVTHRLVIHASTTPLFQLNSTVLFSHLQDLEVSCYHDHEIAILPCLEQIKRLEIWHGIIPVCPLNIDLPLVHTLQWLRLGYSTTSWMLGRSFEKLRAFDLVERPNTRKNQSRRSRYEGLLARLPACTTLRLGNLSGDHLHFLSCPNAQILQWQ